LPFKQRRIDDRSVENGSLVPVRPSASLSKLGLMLFAALLTFGWLGAAEAEAQTRQLKIYFTHTKERGVVTFKKNGRYVQSGLDELNRLLRDWRRNEPTKMDPRLFDLIWEVYQASGSKDYIHVVSAYRSPNTNNMLRSRSSGVAKNSQHTLGKAMDFYLPDVPVKRVRELGMKFQVGGVGYYPNSGSPFVHLDVGSVRAWPRMSRDELVRIFPDGKTIHLPPDGRKLAGYDAALADYKRRVGASEIAVAGGGSRNSDGASGGGGGGRNLLAMLFNRTGDEDEEPEAIVEAPQRQIAQAPQAAPQQAAPAAAAPQQVALLPASRAPIPIVRPVIGQVPAPQVASLAPVGPQTPPPGVSLAEATLPAGGAPAPAVAVAEAPAPEEKPEFTDLASLTVPVPQILGDRSGVAVYAAAEAPAFEGRDVTDIVTAEAARTAAQDAIQTALVPLPSDRPALAALDAAAGGNANSLAAETASTEMAALAAQADNGVVVPQSRPAAADLRATSAAEPVAQPADRPVEVASLGSVPGGAGNGAAPMEASLAARMNAAVVEPRKGGRPTIADAEQSKPRAVRAEPTLTETMISSWAIGRARLATVERPVKSPRFVTKELRTAPEAVYTSGFSTEPVEAEGFTGSAVNFLSFAKFAKAE
jgi:uncharacterized protein YcbK (DUF882 family)